MKIIKTTHTKDGKIRTTVECDADETLLTVRLGAFYRMGEPLHDEVIADHIIESMQRVAWCSVEQCWRDA